jgi:hypothetical protein
MAKVKLDIEAVRAECAALRDPSGTLLPEAMVEKARDKTSAMHYWFTWDVDEAAQKRWEDEARDLIRHLRISIVINDTVYIYPQYVRDPSVSASQQGYIETIRLRNDKDNAKEMLVREMSRISALMQRARSLAHVVDLVVELDALAESILGVQKRLETL